MLAQSAYLWRPGNLAVAVTCPCHRNLEASEVMLGRQVQRFNSANNMELLSIKREQAPSGG